MDKAQNGLPEFCSGLPKVDLHVLLDFPPLLVMEAFGSPAGLGSGAVAVAHELGL